MSCRLHCGSVGTPGCPQEAESGRPRLAWDAARTLRTCPPAPGAGRSTLTRLASAGPAAVPLGGQGQGAEERRVVSVLFVDLVGFTRHRRGARSRGSEARPGSLLPVRAERDHALRRPCREVHRRRRDGPLRRPRRLRRRPRARGPRGLRDPSGDRAAARRRPRLDLEVRIGVSTGEAFVDLDADRAAGEGMASGDVVVTAFRLQHAAPPGGILVGEATYRATRRTIEYAEQEPVTAKGKPEPLRAWAAAGPRELGREARRAARRPERRALVPPLARRPRGRRPAHGHARRAAGNGEVTARLGAQPARRGRLAEHDLAAGAMPLVRHGGELLRVRPDREGAGRHPRERHGGDGRAQAERSRRRARRRPGGARLDRGLPPAPRRPRRRRAAERRPPRRGVRGLAPVRRGRDSVRPRRPRLRGHALGRRRPARLRRAPLPLCGGPAAHHRLHRPARAPRPATGLGRGRRARAALGRGHDRAGRRAHGPLGDSARRPQRPGRPGGRERALRRGVRAHAPGAARR